MTASNDGWYWTVGEGKKAHWFYFRGLDSEACCRTLSKPDMYRGAEYMKQADRCLQCQRRLTRIARV